MLIIFFKFKHLHVSGKVTIIVKHHNHCLCNKWSSPEKNYWFFWTRGHYCLTGFKHRYNGWASLQVVQKATLQGKIHQDWRILNILSTVLNRTDYRIIGSLELELRRPSSPIPLQWTDSNWNFHLNYLLSLWQKKRDTDTWMTTHHYWWINTWKAAATIQQHGSVPVLQKLRASQGKAKRDVKRKIFLEETMKFYTANTWWIAYYQVYLKILCLGMKKHKLTPQSFC